MNIYFKKHNFTGGVYDIKTFYDSNLNYKLDAAKTQNIDLKIDDGSTSTIVNTMLPDNTNVRDYTHIIVPSYNKIYAITEFKWVNITQTRINLLSDELLSNYASMREKNILLNRSSDSSLFVGLHDVKDMAIRHNAISTDPNIPNNYTGPWVLYTFQEDATDLEFTFGEINNYPIVGEFANMNNLLNAFPEIDVVPWRCDYWLKFAKVNNILYQAIYSDKDGIGVRWVKVPDPTFDYVLPLNTIKIANTVYDNNVKISNIGDISTRQIAFPLDTTLITEQTLHFDSPGVSLYTSTDVSLPSFYNIRSFNHVDKLISIKLIPSELLDIKDLDSVETPRLSNITVTFSPDTITPNRTGSNYWFKRFSSPNVHVEYKRTIDNTISKYPYLTGTSVETFKDIFTFNYSNSINSLLDYEPFKKYYLFLWGELIELPARYLLYDINVRIANTSTDVLFEVYTDKMNVITSGRLQWFTRYAVDQLKLFEANNPTYKEQFVYSQLKDFAKGLAGGAATGFLSIRSVADKRNPAKLSANLAQSVGAAAGFGIMDAAFNYNDLLLQEKALKIKADEIMGQNDVAMTIIKGFAVQLITVTPETEALDLMNTQYSLTGFPTSKLTKVKNLNVTTNNVFTNSIIVSGQLLDIVGNIQITERINRQLEQGVVLLT